MEARRYPLDIDALNKGDRITVEAIEELSGQEYGTIRYSMETLKLRQKIMDHRERIGTPVTVKIEKGCLCVLTDEEAVDYNHRTCTTALRGMVRGHKRQMQTDVANLTEVTLREHQRSLIVCGKMIQGALSGRKDGLQLHAHRRTTPGLLND